MSELNPLQTVGDTGKGDSVENEAVKASLPGSPTSSNSTTDEKMDVKEDQQPCTSTSGPGSGIKRRSSSSHKRNYRNMHSVRQKSDDASDEDSDLECKSVTKENEKEKLKLKNSTEYKNLNDSLEDQSSNDSMPILSPQTNIRAQDEHMSSASSSSSSSTSQDADSDASIEFREDLDERPFYLPEVDSDNDDDPIYNPEVASSSSSSSVHLMPDDDDDDDVVQESSSESSDCALDDLDERPAGTKPTVEGTESDNNAETAAKKKKKEPKQKLELPKVLLKPKPKHKWNGPRELFRREMGYNGRVQPQSAEVFRSQFYGSLFSVERLELMKKLDGHRGCVNCLNFNYAGTKLASGSDDLYIKIWNYGLGKLLTSFHSGHRANVFQAKFLPLVGLDTMIVSCARDNQVRLTELNSSGQVCSSRKLAQHRGAAHKLSVNADNPHIILSCGEDAVVYSIDVREEKPQRLLSLREKGKKVALYSISCNPLSPVEFCVTGRDEFVRLYDTRKLRRSSVPVPQGNDEAGDAVSHDSTPLKRFCPNHLVESRTKPNVTAGVYSYNGKEIVASYNDENIYLFDSTHSDMADCVKVYEGHRNSATVKGVNFFGDRSQFIISGSDCGHVFIWDKETESIVNFFRGDENGVVNCLEPHPSAPILATSGLDDDVKIWIPSNEHVPKMGDLATTVRKNLKSRKDEVERQPDALDGQIMWALWNHIRQADRQRRREAGQISDSEDSAEDEAEDEDGDGDSPSRGGVECVIC